MDINKEYITCAAIWYDDGKKHPNQHMYKIETGFVVAGCTHAACIAVIPTNPTMNGGMETEQGFITSTGRFVDRIEAKKIAIEQEQIIDNSRAYSEKLFSEDILQF